MRGLLMCGAAALVASLSGCGETPSLDPKAGIGPNPTLPEPDYHLFTPVKTLGKHTVKIKLHADVAVELGFDVVSENPIEPVTTEEKPAGERTEKRSERTERTDRRPRKETKE